MAIGAAIAGVAGGVLSSRSQSKRSDRAAQSQGEASDKSVKEQRRQFNAMKEILSPYVDAGSPALQLMAGYADMGPQALSQQRALAGVDGYGAQQEAISSIEQSPLYQSQVRQGEEAILQNASATGGLRGGNTQAALAQFRPQMLNQAIESQYAKLGGLTNLGAQSAQNLAGIGQASAAGQGAAGMGMANSIGAQYGAAGTAQAQNFLSQGKIQAGMIGDISKFGGQMMGGFGGSGPSDFSQSGAF